MSKNSKIIITTVVILLLVGLTVFLFLYQNKKGETGVDIIKNSLPFGKSSGDVPGFTVEPLNDGDKFLTGKNEQSFLPKLFQIHKNAIAGASSFEQNADEDINEKETIVRYLERGVGHIFETNLSTTQQEKRISNVTRLKIYEALWGENGKSVIIRYLDNEDGKTIRSFLIKLTGDIFTEEIPGEVASPVKEPETEGVFLPENIKNLTMSNDLKKIFYIFDTGSVALGTVYNLETGNASQIFRSVFTEWLPQWPNKNTITLTTKPSSAVPGIIYFLNIMTEKVTKILGGINGLTTLTSPDGENVLYSESTRGGFTLNLYNTANQSKQKLPFVTLPEKCSWSNLNATTVYCAVPTIIPIGEYPDQWYQGLSLFSDQIWKIDINTFTTEIIITSSDMKNEEIDGINLNLSPKEDFLFFTNKKDFSFWGVRI